MSETIRSQQGEGWQLRKTRYDDGGLSDATMERPALKRLLAEIQEELVDVVVVYKVDRLTRSLDDYSRESLAIEIKQSITSERVVMVMNRLSACLERQAH